MTRHRNRRPLFLAAVACAALAGCASQAPTTARPAASSVRVSLQRTATTTTRPADPRADLTLEQIQPNASLPAPSTQPAKPAPLSALQTYAQARAALIDNQ